MNKIRLLAVCVVFVALLLVTGTSVRAQDLVKVAPKNCTVVLDNAQVRVIRVVLKPGDKLEMHSHPAHIVYSLTEGKAKYTSADGKTEERDVKAGQAVWSDGATHSTENVGTTESRALVVELKK
ncbi:MAG: cupin domain-containing protein [Terriglobia bacterium]|jgi:quercetin dioxygenase-like cupin family protein